MDEINNFFCLSSKFERVNVQSGSSAARATRPKQKPEVVNIPPKRQALGTEYVDECKKKELEDMIQAFDNPPRTSTHFRNNNDYDRQSEFGAGSVASSVASSAIDSVYERYNFDRKLPKLPIVDAKDEILETIRNNTVVVLEGATGCGKTTQVPQFILDEAYETGRRVDIIVTQPRRIAAMSIAKRVSSERGLNGPNIKFPHIIGYQVGLDNKTCEDTRITYVTTGVLLEKLISYKRMRNFTHIILDEVHERSQDMDFLFIVIRKLLTRSPTVKIILMSATIEASEFSEYFKLPRNGVLMPAPIIKVERMNHFIVSQFFLSDLTAINIKTKTVNRNDPTIDEDMYRTALKLIYVADRIDAMEEEPLHVKPTILVFLPGIYEISFMAKLIEESSDKLEHNDFLVTVLHSTMTHELQAEVLKKPILGKRMIILATNIAESSITVPDVKYVIDFCLTRILVNDSSTNITSLQLEWCSRNNCRQRAGRTGRTMDGRVYHLVPKSFYENEMDESSRPEILKNPLENVILKAKQLGMGPPHKILALAMDQPKLSDIRNTILLLKESGAMLRTCDGTYTDFDGDLTMIGHVMAALPVDFHIARLVILGHCFGVLSECIIIGAGLTTKSIFEQSFKKVLVSYSKKLRWSNGSGSDLLAILNAYQKYVNHKNNHDDTRRWIDRHYLSEKSLVEMSNLIEEITSRLAQFGITERTSANRIKWTSVESTIILKVVIAGAFYPHYFVRPTNEIQNSDAYREINGRNPCNTVYFSGFDENYIGPLYVESIKKAFKQCSNLPENIQVTFDEGTEKLYVTFNQTKASVAANIDTDLDFVESVPGEVCVEMYKALKLRKSGRPITVNVMHPNDALKYAEKHKLGNWHRQKFVCKKREIKNIEMVCLPRKHVKQLFGRITQYETDFNRFWFRPEEEEILFREIGNELNNLNRDIVPFSNHSEITIGHVLAAPYNAIYYRAKVLLILQDGSDIFYRVMFIDIGSEDNVVFGDLRRFRGVSAQYIDLPPRAFECRLAYLQPSELNSARHSWRPVMNEFKKLTNDVRVCAEIFSVVNGVASIEIQVDDGKINQILIKKGYARACDEDHMSKVDHDMRNLRQSKRTNEFENDDECDQIADEIRKMLGFEEHCDVPEPHMSLRHIEVTLNGPKSPLEAQIYSSMQSGKSKIITVEPNSVNSILLNSNPQDLFEKMLVAANVTENQNEGTLTARQTTTMPNIPGFGALMALIFSPRCEFFRDRYKSRFTSIICGLGEFPGTHKALYPEHDIILNLDTEIDIADIAKINNIRFSMDTLLQMKPGQKCVKITEHEQYELSMDIKDSIFDLLKKDRRLIGVDGSSNIGWSKYDRNDICRGKDVYGKNAIFPFHNILTLAAEDSPQRVDQRNNLIQCNKMLNQMKSTDVTLRRPIKCLLCNVDLERISELRIHLYSRLHFEQVKRIEIELEQ